LSRLATADRPLRVAIIGAGPAGLYAADALLKKPDLVLTIDVFNRFPTPFGLVRDGVAPDHQSIKAVARVLDATLADPRVRLFGNVTYGVDVHHKELQRFYDQIVYAVGAQADRRMSIPGEDLPNSFPAISFVGWYNGHPDYRELPVDLSCERAVVVGNGNVAMDVARMLVTSTDALRQTDMAGHAVEALERSSVREVVVLGRRGAAQASFTTPELRELGKLDGVDVVVDPANIELDPASAAAAAEDRTARANLKHLQAYAADPGRSAPRRIVLHFLASPVEVVGRRGRITALRIEQNELVVDAFGGSGRRAPAGSATTSPTPPPPWRPWWPTPHPQGDPRRPPRPRPRRGGPAPQGHRLHHLPGLAGPGRPRGRPRRRLGPPPGQGHDRPGDAGDHPPGPLTLWDRRP
jgi:ferredoxin--NADP+ reductase